MASQRFYQSGFSTSDFTDLLCRFGSVRTFDDFQFSHSFLEAVNKEGPQSFLWGKNLLPNWAGRFGGLLSMQGSERETKGITLTSGQNYKLLLFEQIQ